METEFWVEKAAEELRARRLTAPRILDLFAGSGAIGVSVLARLPEARGDFGEIEARHLPLIEKNIRENGIDAARTRVFETDVWDRVPQGGYDAVFANPPYISEGLAERVQESVLLEEPREALFAEEDGFALLRKTIEGAGPHLAEGGVLYLEHEPEQAEKIRAGAGENGLSADVRKDQFGIPRWSALRVA
jgi:release factor glutamine methyltransferase